MPFERMARLVEIAMGAGWWHDPVRWPTRDGFAPYQDVFDQWAIVKAVRAWDRQNLIQAMAIPKMDGLPQRVAMDNDRHEAFGG